MVLIFAGASILVLCGTALVIVGRHIPAVASASEGELSRVRGEMPLYRKIFGFIRAEQRTLLLKMTLKLVHRMRIISLRADSASGKLIDRLRLEHRTSEEEAKDAVEARREAFVNKLLEHNIDEEAYREITEFYLKKEGVPSEAIKKQTPLSTVGSAAPRATLADMKPRKKRSVIK